MPASPDSSASASSASASASASPDSSATAIRTVCVFCSSSQVIDEAYYADGAALGTLLGEAGLALVYGGSDLGIMGAVARAVRAAGSEVISVMPRKLYEAIGDPGSAQTSFVVTETMQQRKLEMERRADAFLVLPGGYGTLAEFSEVIDDKGLHYHEKPIIFLNTLGFFDPFFAFVERFQEEGFATKAVRGVDFFRGLYHIADTPQQVVDFLLK